MDPRKISVLLVVFVGVGLAQSERNATGITDCSNRCMWRARCSPYYKDLVWSLVNNVCRVYQNGCIFGSENCMRVNRCLQPMVATTAEKCRRTCLATTCPTGGPQVCAWFPHVDANGNNGGRQLSFPNRCQLNIFACLRSQAYVGDPTIGPCPT